MVLITFFHFRDLEEYIVSGQFDMYLTRPIPPFVHFMAARFPLFSLAQLLFSSLVFVWRSRAFYGTVVRPAREMAFYPIDI